MADDFVNKKGLHSRPHKLSQDYSFLSKSQSLTLSEPYSLFLCIWDNISLKCSINFLFQTPLRHNHLLWRQRNTSLLSCFGIPPLCAVNVNYPVPTNIKGSMFLSISLFLQSWAFPRFAFSCLFNVPPTDSIQSPLRFLLILNV